MEPLVIERLLREETHSKLLKYLSSEDVFTELQLQDDILKLSLKKLRSLIMKCKNKNRELESLTIEIKRGLATIDVLRDDYVWEHLNIGHWKSVPSMWRKTYTFLSLMKATLLLEKGEIYENAIRECDLGLLMGEPILANILSSVAEQLSSWIVQKRLADKNMSAAINLNNKNGNVPSTNGKLVNQWRSRFEIQYEENPSLESFSLYMTKEEPLLIMNSIEHWPARQKWDVNFIKEVAGFRTVPVEIGPKYTSEDWTQKLMTIDEFIDNYMDSKVLHEDRDKCDFGYIAQHHLFEQISALQKDIKTPDYCNLGNRPDVEINAWFGPANTVSPTHYDPKHNLLVQIFGTKLVRLYPPSESKYLKPYPSTSLLFNTSQIDVEDTDLLSIHPEIENAKYCEFLLKPGVILYIPPKWWHYVKSLTPCFSVSYWFD